MSTFKDNMTSSHSNSSNDNKSKIYVNGKINENLITLAEYLSQRENITISQAKKLIRRKQVLIGDKSVVAIDHVLNRIDDDFENLEKKIKIKPPKMEGNKYDNILSSMEHVPKLEVVYEDDHMAIVNKPRGMSIFSDNDKVGDGMNVKTALIKSLKRVIGIEGALHRPSPVHRIDVDTSGILVCAKTNIAMNGLSKQFRRSKIDEKVSIQDEGDSNDVVEKEYACIVAGIVRGEGGTINTDVKKKPALTYYKPCPDNGKPIMNEEGRCISTLRVKIETGRTNQIRRHLSSIGHPLINDVRFWRNPEWDVQFPKRSKDVIIGSENEGDTFCLVSKKVSLTHPVTKKRLTFEIDEPDYFDTVRKNWQNRSS